MARQDINIGSSPNDGTGDSIRVGGDKINDNFIELYGKTGWAQYTDTQYTDVSPFAITADTKVTLPNNAGDVLDIQKPLYIPTFYDEVGQVITGRNGDGISWSIELKVVPSVSADFVELSIDIGGAVGEIYTSDYAFPKGANVVRNIIYAIPSAYTLGTWEANGGAVKIVSNGACDIYGIRYVITQTHKAR